MSEWLSPPWEPKDGEIEWVYKDMPHGSRCLWACRWRIPGGYLMPEQIAPVAELTEAQAFYELKDASIYPMVEPGRQMEIVYFLADVNGPADLDLGSARSIIGAIRKQQENYPEYVANWNPPEQIIIHNYRPGWPPLE